jgi:hypothetical protein
VTLYGILRLGFILIFFGLMLLFAFLGSSLPGVKLRRISAFTKLRRVIGLAVEAGSRLHISIGRGGAIGTESASAFIGLSVLERLAGSASTSDNPPIATAGEGAIGTLAQETLRGTYSSIGLSRKFDPDTGRVTGLTPFSYAAGTLPLVSDEKTGANVLLGHFGSEVALITDAGERSGNMTLAGTDNLPAQAVLFASAHEPLVGEELYAGGAYLNVGTMHDASLRTQDIFRWALVILIILGVLAKFLGFDTMLENFINEMIGGLL